MYDAPLWNCAKGNLREIPVCTQPFEEIVSEKTSSTRSLLGSQKLEVPFGDPCFLHPVEQPLEASEDAVARLMVTVVGVTPKEVVELRRALMKPHAKVQLGRGQMVLIGKEDALGNVSVNSFHRADDILGR